VTSTPHPSSDTDPQLDALLDEALAPGPAPAGLDERIVDQTRSLLPADRADRGVLAAAEPVAVAGRIGFGGRPWRAAAALLLAGALATAAFFAVSSNGSGGSATSGDPIDTPGTHAAAAASLPDALERLAAAEAQTQRRDEAIDDRIAWLEMQLDWAESDDLWARDSLAALDRAMAGEASEQSREELDLYF
jgi:hypothetical protein